MKKAFFAYSSYLTFYETDACPSLLKLKLLFRLLEVWKGGVLALLSFHFWLYIYIIIDCVYWKCYDRYFVFIQMQ